MAAASASPRYLSQTEAQKIDEELFSDYGFSVYQLMELAGLSVSHAVYDAYPVAHYRTVLAVAGPGTYCTLPSTAACAFVFLSVYSSLACLDLCPSWLCLDLSFTHSFIGSFALFFCFCLLLLGLQTRK